MSWQLVLPALLALLLWWGGTGLILWLNRLPRGGQRAALVGGAGVALIAMAGLVASADDTSAGGAGCAFLCAIIVWGWHEMAFLMGVVTGPRRSACPPGARGWRRFTAAVQALAWHELALAAQGLLLWALLHDAPNALGWWTFAILWAARLSAKLNVFLGVRNLNENWLPPQLAYLHSYFGRRPVNWLFPFTLALLAWAATLAWQAALDPAAADFAAVAASWAATLLSLALLEHVLMVLPLSADALWGWALRSRTP